VILTLARDMGVNLAGIEIILNMREKLIEMERQMGEFAQVVQQEIVASGGVAHAGKRCRGMRLCGRRRGLCGSRQFSVNSNQSLRRKRQFLPQFSQCRILAVYRTRPYAVWRGKRTGLKTGHYRIRNGIAGWKPALHMALENCTLCRGTGWKMVPRPDGAAGKVAVACDCGMEERASRAMERAKIPKRYEHCDFESYVTDLTDGKTWTAQHAQSLKQAKLFTQGFVREYPVRSEKGLLFMGPSGVGKTHLAVAH